MGLGYPGGPLIQELAQDGDRKKYNFTISVFVSASQTFSIGAFIIVL